MTANGIRPVFCREKTLQSFKIHAARDFKQVIGYMDYNVDDSDMGIRIGFRNSYDKSMSFALVAGNTVWICSNGMISGEIQTKKIHRGEQLSSIIDDKIISGFKLASDVYESNRKAAEQFENILISEDTAHQIVGQLFLEDQILNMTEEILNMPSDKKQTIHWKWIESLKNIAIDKPACNESIILPEFMNSDAWLDKELTTIMGSWAQLKHDTILYSKQSTTMWICSTPTGYVEPYPEFYKSLRTLSQLYINALLPFTSIVLILIHVSIFPEKLK